MSHPKDKLREDSPHVAGGICACGHCPVACDACVKGKICACGNGAECDGSICGLGDCVLCDGTGFLKDEAAL